MIEDNASILIVDDRPEKLLALEAVLEDLGPRIVRAYSGRDALRQVLAEDFAVILLDVNMPGMDGFETASLIRQRKSSAHVPIIFITAFGDEMHASRGYELGAVDYILAPVVPEVLRTKVGVFVDLFRKSQQLRRQADWLRAQAEQLHKLTAASIAINSALSVDQMLRVVTDTARQIIGAHQAGAVAVLGPGRHRELRVASFSEKFTDAETCCPMMEATDAWRAVQESAKPLRLTQAEVERIAVWTESPDPLRIGLPPVAVNLAPAMRGWLAAPLTGRDGNSMGVVQLSDRYEGEFTNDDEAILVQLAQMASIALENSLYAEEREANRVKDEFLATLSHELRTPLNAILGWTQLLRSGPMNQGGPADPDEVAHGLEVIERNARSQAKLIEDLLDVSRITTGKMRLHMKPTEIGKVVHAAVDVVRPAAEAKKIAIDCRIEPAAEATVISADADRLQQVFWNLLSNAVKFTPAGGQIACSLAPGEDSVVVRISDTGAGIDPKFLPCVFDRFRQADSSSTRMQGGLGIGLTIVRHIVELHGGTVLAESAGEGSGSTFTVTLPTSAPASGPETAIGGDGAGGLASSPANGVARRLSDLRGLNVLVVDDDPDAREVLRQILSRSGATVASAASAAEALTLIGRSCPHVLLSDIAMPEEDGYALVRRVRSLPADSGGSIPAIALSAYARDEDRRLSLAAGFQAHLAKPVEPHELIDTLARWAGDHVNMEEENPACTVPSR